MIIFFSCVNKGNQESYNKNSNYNTKIEKNVSKKECIVDSSQFYYYKLSKTKIFVDNKIITKMKELDSCEINNWLNPILKNRLYL